MLSVPEENSGWLGGLTCVIWNILSVEEMDSCKQTPEECPGIGLARQWPSLKRQRGFKEYAESDGARQCANIPEVLSHYCIRNNHSHHAYNPNHLSKKQPMMGRLQDPE